MSDNNKTNVGNIGAVVVQEGDTCAVMSVAGFGDIKLKLFPECAPVAVKNFIDLAKSGYYKNKTFHRIIKGFMIQGGSPNGDGMGDGVYPTFGVEPHPNAIHKYGALSMANAGGQNSQQFFIVNAIDGASFLDGDYTVFGQVVDGYEVLDDLTDVEVKYNENGELSKPVDVIEIVDVVIGE